MQDLKEMALLLRQLGIHPLKSGGKKDATKLGLLYKGIVGGQYTNDREALLDLYQGEQAEAKYRKLKADLRVKIIEAIQRADFGASSTSDYQKAYFDCHRDWMVFRDLIGQNASKAALSVGLKLFRQAERFEFTLLCMDIMSYLRIHYGLREGNERKFMESDKLYEHYRRIYDAESLAERLYVKLMVAFVNQRSGQEKLQEFANIYYQNIEQYLKEFSSYRLHLYGHMIGVMRYTAVNDNESALYYVSEVIDFFKRKPYEARVPLQIFYYQRLICNIQLRQFEAGKASAEQCLELMKEGTYNWFKYRELLLLLSFHTQHFDEVVSTLRSSLDHPRFEFLPENTRELWLIYEAYTCLLAAYGKLEWPDLAKFRASRFVNSTPIYSKDKSGLNISILIIKLLFLLLERRHGALLDEVEAVDQYCYRHLRGKDTRRSYYFLKMLIQIPLARFHGSEIKRKSRLYIERMLALPVQVGNQINEIEIIPYEILWEYVMESLANVSNVGKNQKVSRIKN